IGNDKTNIGDEIKRQVIDLKLTESIFILGVQDEIEKYLAISDVLLFPSLWEGLPGVILESLSAGVPVICSDIGSNVEIAKSNIGINLMSLDDDDKIWASKLHEIIKMGKQKTIADNF